MSNFIKTVVDPIGFFHDNGLLDKIGGKKESAPEPAAAASAPAGSSDTGKLSDEEAAKIARQKMYRSGTVMTTPLGEAVTQDQLAGARLR